MPLKYTGGLGRRPGYRFRPSKPKKPAAPPAAPTAPNPTVPAAQPSTPDPRDSTYFTSAAQAEFGAQNQLSQLDEQQKNDAADRQKALSLLQEQLPRQKSAATASANNQGLFNSTTLGNTLGDVETQNLRQNQNVQEQYDRRDRARSAARQAIQQGLSLQEAALMAQSVDRQTQADQASADAGSLAYEPTSTPSNPATSRPSYLPAGYERWSPQMKSRYWARKRAG